MRLKSLSGILAVVALAGCGGGGDGGGGGGPNNNHVLAKAASSGDGQSATVATALGNPFCARVTDGGSAKAGVTVTWATTSGGSMSAPSTQSAADGTACSTLTLGNTAGAQTATASSTNATGSPLTFNATGTPDQAVAIQINGGNNQDGTINNALAQPLSVKIMDQFSNGVGGTDVGWAVTVGTATPAPALSSSNASGIASTNLTLGGTAGSITITATSVGLTGSPVTFNATANVLPTAITISVANFNFSPSNDTVAVGGTVTWTWTDIGHSMTSTGNTSFVDDPAGVVGALPHSYGPITFNTPGTYFYYCTQHGGPGNPPTGMSGRIVVQ